jgi:hypothetical protein
MRREKTVEEERKRDVLIGSDFKDSSLLIWDFFIDGKLNINVF